MIKSFKIPKNELSRTKNRTNQLVVSLNDSIYLEKWLVKYNTANSSHNNQLFFYFLCFLEIFVSLQQICASARGSICSLLVPIF